MSLLAPPLQNTALADGTPQDRGSHVKIVRENPASNVPFVEGATAPPSTNYVSGVAEVGNTVVVAGKFPSVRNPGSGASISRANIFAYDKSTGVVNSTFVPSVNGPIDAVAIAPDGQSVFIVGNFSTVNGQPRFGLAKLNVSDGQLSAGWTTTTEGRVRDAKVVGNRLFLGGDFWRVGGVVRDRLAVVNATTGAVESFNQPITVPRNGNHAWVATIDVSPDGSQLLAGGNFLEVNGQSRIQIAMFDANAGTLLPWSTQGYSSPCNFNNFWTYLRDLEFSPDASYFAVATTGGPHLSTLCDAAVRWENTPSTVNANPTWADISGGDTLTAVAVTTQAIYVGGHNRWMNNHLGLDRAREGAVERPGVSALDPLNGVPLSWNPTRDRGSVVYTLHGTSAGLYIGADTDLVNHQQKGKLAFWPFPVVGGLLPQPTPVNLPVTVYESRSDGSLTRASYNGTTASDPVTVPNTGVNWAQTLGVTLEAGKVYYTKSNNLLYSRTFDGSSFGPETNLVTDQIYTYQENGTTFNGPSLVGVTAMFWDNGRLYYTRSGQTNWFYRYLSLDSGIIGSQTFTVASQGGSGFSPSGVTGMEVIGNHLYYTKTDNTLNRIQWANGAPVNGTVQVMSGPGVDGRSWNGRDLFVTSTTATNNPPTVSVTAPANGATVSGTVGMAANAADTDGTVSRVDFKVDGNIVGTDTAAAGGWTFSWNTTGTANGSHVVTATATDNQGAATTSTPISVTVNNVVANNPPTVSVTAPANGSTVSGTVGMAANAADSDGTVAKVDFKVDGNIVGTDTNAAGGWTFNWNSTTTINGAHAVTATATDNQGAATTSTTVNVTVDNVAPNQPPSVSVTAPTNGSTLSGTVGMAANAADSDGTVAKVDFKVDGTVVGTDTNAAGGWTFNWNSTTTTNGAHAVTATATDNSGAAATSALVSITVSNVGPPVSNSGGDEMFFYRTDGLFRFYDVRDNGSLGSPMASGSNYTQGWDSISAVDLDGDGGDEMFFYRTDGLFRFYDVRKDGSLPAPFLAGSNYTSGWDSITAVDLDGDGQDEMFFYREDGLFRFYDIKPNGDLGSPILAGSNYTAGWTTITAVDLDGDGQDEMFFYRADGLFRYYNIKPNGDLGSPILAGGNYTTGWDVITAIDLEGDGQDETFFYRKDGLYRFYDVGPDGTLPKPLLAGNNYTPNWTAITAINLE